MADLGVVEVEEIIQALLQVVQRDRMEACVQLLELVGIQKLEPGDKEDRVAMVEMVVLANLAHQDILFIW
jgi:hypothetical protein